MKLKTMVLAVLFCQVVAIVAPAQEADKDKARRQSSYKLEYKLYEVQDGKRTNERSFVIYAKGDGRNSSIRIGNRVPIYTSYGDQSKGNSVQYMDVGLRIEAQVEELADGEIMLWTKIEITDVVSTETGTDSKSGNPVLRNVSNEESVRLGTGKPLIIASLEDTNTKKTFQVEVAATKVK